jgi:hypothetical protein
MLILSTSILIKPLPGSALNESKVTTNDMIRKSRTIPIWFKDKLIKLAPKIPGNDQLDNMRPISLYEIIQKIWTTVVARRIYRVWHEKVLLHDAQYKNKLNNGAQMALFNVINEIEGVNFQLESRFVTFWYI